MSDNVTPTLEQKRGRRGLLALIGVGGAAAVAALLGRRNAAEAAPLQGTSSDGTAAVHGNNTGWGTGVVGWGINGRGVFGWSDNRPGVEGSGYTTGVKGTGKIGVRGVGNGNSGSMGVHAKNSATKLALRTEGRLQMDCVRTKSLPNRSNLVTLPSGVNAGSDAVVLATAQSNPGNDAFISRAWRVDSKHIRIVFNKKPATSTKVAYWVVFPG